MNLFCNPQAQWLRRQVSGLVSDGDFSAIQWKTLAEVGSVNFEQIKRGIELTLQGSGHAGLMQTLEQDACWPIDGGNASASFEADGDLTNFHVALLGFGGTPNDPSYPVSAWGASPSLATDWTILGSQSFTLGASPQTFALENVSVPSGCSNIALMVWGEGAMGDKLRLRNFCLNAGPVAVPSFPAPHSSWLYAERFYQHYTEEEMLNIVCSDRGLMSNSTHASMGLSLRNPMRRGNGFYGTQGIKVDWEMLSGQSPASGWWAYAGGQAARFAGVPAITCHHTHFINFSIPLQSALPTNTAVQIRSYANDSTLTIDGQI